MSWLPHRRRLRSASIEQLEVPTCRRSTIGGRAFPVAGAKVWNGLPSEVTSASSLSVFKNRLKTYLFRRCYETVWLSITFPFPSHYLPPQNSVSCNSFYCLGHSKNVYDDDDETQYKTEIHVEWMSPEAVVNWIWNRLPVDRFQDEFGLILDKNDYRQ